MIPEAFVLSLVFRCLECWKRMVGRFRTWVLCFADSDATEREEVLIVRGSMVAKTVVVGSRGSGRR